MYNANYMRIVSDNVNESLESKIWFAAQHGLYSIEHVVPTPETLWIVDDYRREAERLARDLERKGYKVSVHYEEDIARSTTAKVITSVKCTLKISWG